MPLYFWVAIGCPGAENAEPSRKIAPICSSNLKESVVSMYLQELYANLQQRLFDNTVTNKQCVRWNLPSKFLWCSGTSTHVTNIIVKKSKIAASHVPTHSSKSPPTTHPISTEKNLHHPILLAQAQRVLSILLRPCGRARCIANAASCILGHVADTLGRVTESASRTLNGVAENVTESADCNGVSC